MIIRFHKNFSKDYKKADKKIQEKFKARLRLFSEDPFDPLLGNHALHAEFAGFRSINVTGDMRAIYKIVSDVEIEFVTLDSHSNLYS